MPQNNEEKKKPETIKKPTKLSAKAKKEYDKYKQKYFDYYDDVKSHTHDIYDW